MRQPIFALAVALACGCSLLAACDSSATQRPERPAGATSPAAAAEQFYRAVLSTKHVPIPTCQRDENRSIGIQTVQGVGQQQIVQATKVVNIGARWIVTIKFAPDGSASTRIPVVKEHGRYYACP